MKNRFKPPTLSKSRFMAGIQCHKRLYFECYHRDLAEEIDATQQALFDSGTDVGALARNLFPGGLLIEADYIHMPAALTATNNALTENKRMPLYEAAFQYEDIRTRVDILKPVAGAYSLIEVKSSTSLKEEYLMDAAVQYYVLKGAGIDVKQVCLAYLNKEYVYPGGEYDLQQLFKVEDITVMAQELQPEISIALELMRVLLSASGPPDIKPGRQCSKPYECSFFGFCHRDLPEHHISQLPRLTETLEALLDSAGINDIRDIPAGFPALNPTQQRVRDCVVNGTTYLDDGIRQELSGLAYPIHFLDFETFNPALPLYPGTRPYEVIPFQWSDHVLLPDGRLLHHEFLAGGDGDPRPDFAESLISTLGQAGSIVVYSGYEAGRIRALAESLPRFSAELLAILPGIFDLLPRVRTYCYHPGFHGSFSIKKVLPALVPEMSYKDLVINDGGLASLAYFEIINPQTTPERQAELRKNLLKYCARDTEAMVKLVERLRLA